MCELKVKRNNVLSLCVFLRLIDGISRVLVEIPMHDWRSGPGKDIDLQPSGPEQQRRMLSL